MADLEPVADGKLLEVLRQLIGARNSRAFEQNGDHGDLSLKCGCDLHTHKIVRIVQAPLSVLIAHLEPVGSNYSEQNAAFGDLLVQSLNEIDTERDAVDVHEQKICPKFICEAIVNAT